MDYFLFILVNAALFVRPGEVVPDLEGSPVYQYLILAALAVASPRVLAQFTGRSLASRPITLCVLGLWLAVVASHLATMATIEARLEGFEFGKVVLYYLLLVGVIDSSERLCGFVRWLGYFVVALAGLAVLQYHGFIELPGLGVVSERFFDHESATWTTIPRLCSTGIFNDPNDLCLALSLGTFISLYHVEVHRGIARLLWLAPPVLFLYTLVLTQSRGGLLSLAAGLLVVGGSRFGWRRAVALAVLVLPALLVFASARQTSFDVTDKENTGQTRVQLWSEGFELFRQSPVFGIGSGEYAEKVGLVAHNSYVHAFTELGFCGGTLFVGAFYSAIAALARLDPRRVFIADPRLRALRPYLLGAVTAYATGLLSLSRNYVVPTYLVLGLCQAFLLQARPVPSRPAPARQPSVAWQLFLPGVVSVAVIYVAIRLLVRWD
jgi:O-antigen ligase